MKIKRCPFCGAELEHERREARAVPGRPVVETWTHYAKGCILTGLELAREDLPGWARRALPVRCRDCRKNGLLECPLVRIERQQLVFVDHDPDWFCGDGEVVNDDVD